MEVSRPWRLLMIRIFGLLILPLFAASESFAALGERVETLAADQKALSAKRMNADVFKKYSVQELESDSTHIKEYVNNQGIIFAVSWVGLDHPDLSVLLGSYFKTFQNEARKQVRKHGVRHQKLQAENLVVQKWGHMRNLQGRAYDPSLIPEGVTIDEIQ